MGIAKSIHGGGSSKTRLQVGARSRTQEAKFLKKEKIKRATLQLFLKKNELPAVDQIAKKAQMAKGTFYLYFDTREELYLEILHDLYEQAFRSLIEMFRAKPTLTVEEFADVVISYFEEHQEFLLLASLCSSILEGNVSYHRLLAFKQYLRGEMLNLSDFVGPVRRDFAQEQILAAMTLTFAAIIGIWQQSHLPKSLHRLRDHSEFRTLLLDFSQSARLAVAALWRGL